MSTPFSYLDYLNNPNSHNIQTVHQAHGLSHLAASKIALVSRDAYQSWLSVSERRKRTPSVGTWNYFLCQLEAKRIGYPDTHSIFQKTKPLISKEG